MRPLLISGARPNYMKVAPIVRAFRRAGVEPVLVNTWQHFDEAMSGVFMADLGPGVGLLGIGVLVLGIQGARKAFGLDFEGFWLAMGALFFAGGIWGMASPAVPFVSFVLIVAGVLVLASLIRRH